MSKKIYKGYELLKAIADGEINYGTKFKIKDWNEIVVYEQSNLIFREILGTGEEGNNYGKTIFDLWNLDYILSADFELIEETIDIDKIEELDVIKSRKEIFKTIKEDNGKLDKLYSFQLFVAYEVIDKINELVQTVNQHEKEIKELKSLDIEISEKDINEAIKNAREQLNKEIKSLKEK